MPIPNSLPARRAASRSEARAAAESAFGKNGAGPKKLGDTTPTADASTLLSGALQWAADGFRVLYEHPRSKQPALDNWPEAATSDPERIRAWWRTDPRRNVGLLTGNGFLVVDLDDGGRTTLAELEHELGALPLTLTVATPSGGCHLYFRIPADVHIGNSVRTLGPGIDVRAARGQVCAPPSVTDHGAYTFDNDAPLAELPAAWVERLAALTASTSETSSFPTSDDPISEGERNQSLFMYAMRLHGLGGMTRDEIYDAVNNRNAARCQPPLSAHEVKALVGSATRYPSSGNGIVIIRDDTYARRRGAAPADTSTLPEFPTQLLPSSIRTLVENESERLRLPAGMIATAALVTAAAAIGGSRSVYTDDREHPASLWAAIVSESGAGKTPALDLALRPYREAARLRSREIRDARRAFEKWERDKTPTKGEAPYVPQKLRTTDPTTEALAKVLDHAPRGILLDVDELSSWARGLDAYRSKGIGPDRMRYCMIWNRSSFDIERVNRSVEVERPIVSVIGGIQPSALQALNSDSGDGLAQRFLYSCHPDVQEEYASRQSPSTDALRAWKQTVDALLCIGTMPASPTMHTLRMTAEALKAWHDGRDRKTDAIRLGSDAPLYRKFDALAARLALVLTLAENPSAIQVDAPAVDAAWAMLLEYYGPHGSAALAGTSTRPAIRGVDWLRRNGGKASRRELVRAKVAGCASTEDADALIELWRTRGVVKVTTETHSTGGLPSVNVELVK